MKSRSFYFVILGAFAFLLMGMSLWSWVLVDTNFTLIAHADWTRFRELAISIGYFQRQWSVHAYTFLILMLTLVSICIVRRYRGSVVPLLVVVGLVCGLLSYPALSHDLFNYIFDARIVTHYHANPYLHSALDFPADPMLRFMHWVHRTYPYGPTYLLISLVPSFLGMGVFSLTFLLFKTMHVVFFVIAGYLLYKMNKKAGLIFASSPLIIVEGLINTHNDFIALALGIIGLYVIHVYKKRWIGLLVFLTSGLIKYLTLPTILLSLLGKRHGMVWQIRTETHEAVIQTWHLVLVCMIGLLMFPILRQEIQPWYFLNLFVLLPFAPYLFEKLTIFFTGLLLSYYPYVVGGEWGQGGDVGTKRTIILWGCLLNIIVLCAIWISQKFRAHHE